MRYKVYFSALLAAVLMFSTNSYADNLAKPKKEVCIQLYSLRTILDGVNKDGKVSESYTKLLKDLADMDVLRSSLRKIAKRPASRCFLPILTAA